VIDHLAARTNWTMARLFAASYIIACLTGIILRVSR